MADKKINNSYLKEGIYLERIHLGYETWHTYLIYRDGQGQAEIIRGGPSILDIDLKIDAGINISKSKDAYLEDETPKTRFAHKIDIGNKNPRQLWEEMVHIAKNIDSRIDYEINIIDIVSSIKRKEIILQDNAQVCHSVIGTVLQEAGLSISKSLPSDINPINLRGINTNLKNLNALDIGNFDTIESIKDQIEVYLLKHFKESSQMLKDWQSMTPEQKATAIRNGYGLGLSYNTQGIEDLKDLSIEFAQKFEENSSQKIEEINLAINNIQNQKTHNEKIKLLKQTSIASSFDNPYSRELIEQYQDKVIENQGLEVSALDFIKMEITPNQILASNNLENLEKQQHSYFSFESNQKEKNNASIQTMT